MALHRRVRKEGRCDRARWWKLHDKVAWRACAGGVCVCVCVNVWDEGFKGMLDGPRVCVVVGMLYTMCFGAFGAGCVTASCSSEVLLLGN